MSHALSVDVTIERWPLREPFEIAREVMRDLPLIVATLTDETGHIGRGEAAGVDYDGDTPETMVAAIRSVAHHLRSDTSADALNALLPAGGARNAIDCALWDLRAKRTGAPASVAAGLSPLKPVVTAFTIGLGSDDDIRRRARAATSMPLIKLKVDANRHIDLVQIVREEHPRARVVIDANESWTVDLLQRLIPALVELDVELIEQPLPRGNDAALRGVAKTIPIAADESCTDRASLSGLVELYDVINIKLDKSGGLTEALALAHDARVRGLGVMVGNMCGTSLGMAPAFLVAQLAKWVDLDGPLLQVGDREDPMQYRDGLVYAPSRELWG